MYKNNLNTRKCKRLHVRNTSFYAKIEQRIKK